MSAKVVKKNKKGAKIFLNRYDGLFFGKFGSVNFLDPKEMIL